MAKTILAAALLATGLTGAPAAADEAPSLSVGVLKFGTVNWLMDVIETNGLDERHGFALEVVPFAGKSATSVALQSGSVDMIVTDWPWAMRQNAAGADFRFAPYSVTLGSVMVGEGSDIEDLCDLKDRKIGVVGGPLDKSWLLVQARYAEGCGGDLGSDAEALFGAPPLLAQQLTAGAIDATVTYWHFAARLEGEGARELVAVSSLMDDLGVTPNPPLIGFVWSAAAMGERAAVLEGFRAAVRDANALLGDDAEWDRLRPLMRAEDDRAFEGLKTRARAGFLDDWTPEHTAAAMALHETLIRIGGEAYLGDAGVFMGEVFGDGDS